MCCDFCELFSWVWVNFCCAAHTALHVSRVGYHSRSACEAMQVCAVYTISDNRDGFQTGTVHNSVASIQKETIAVAKLYLI